MARAVALVCLLLSGTTLADGWVADGPDPCPASDALRSAGTGPELSPTVLRSCQDRLAGREAPAAPLNAPAPRIACLRPPVLPVLSPPPAAVDPSAWIGRRHFRSPT